MSALVCIGGAAARTLRQLTGYAGGDQEGKECDPVLRISNGELEKGRQEEEVVSCGCENGCESSVRQAPGRGDQQDGQQEAESNRRWIYKQPSKEEQHDSSHNQYAGEKAQDRIVKRSLHVR